MSNDAPIEDEADRGGALTTGIGDPSQSPDAAQPPLGEQSAAELDVDREPSGGSDQTAADEAVAQQIPSAGGREQPGRARDERGRASDARAATLAQRLDASETSFIRQLEELVAQAHADRAVASADRARAEQDRRDAEVDRATAARELARLARALAQVEGELRTAHLDDLTGAYHREVGRLALTHEIDRACRSDGRFVLAFVDVDGLKVVNDRDGHAAGDRVLETVVREIRTRLRSYDLIIRYGGDEFVCGLGGTDLAETERRFDAIAVAVEASAGVGISVGLSALGNGATLDQLTERADAALLKVKAKRRTSP